MTTVRDRLWVWGHEAGSHDREWKLPGPSRMTPTEGALYLGVPNLIMVRYDGKPAPPYQQYTVPFRLLEQVVWSIVGAGGITQDEERARVLDLARSLPNMTGVMMDDFFRQSSNPEDAGVLSLDQLATIKRQLALPERRLDLWVVLYDHQLSLPVQDHLALCDRVTFWTWRAEHLQSLERNWDIVEKLAPTPDKLLGCYMWDYGEKCAMPLERMQKQCETGLRWLHEGRIQGMIFLATCICDLGLETVEWTRDWIAHVGNQVL